MRGDRIDCRLVSRGQSFTAVETIVTKKSWSVDVAVFVMLSEPSDDAHDRRPSRFRHDDRDLPGGGGLCPVTSFILLEFPTALLQALRVVPLFRGYSTESAIHAPLFAFL